MPSPLPLMRAELKKLNALARRYRAALEEIELNPHVNAAAIAKEALKETSPTIPTQTLGQGDCVKGAQRK